MATEFKDIEARLWKVADSLRANSGLRSSEYSTPVLGLIFLKYADTRFRDEIAKLEVDVVALEMLVLRVLSAQKAGKNALDIAGLLKIRGSEIQQRYSELMMLAAGPATVPYVREAMEAGWQGDQAGGTVVAPLAGTYFNMRKTTIYGGSNEVQRNIVAQTVLG